MPIHQNEDGTWQWGKSGKRYKNKLDAIKQMQAIFANGYRLHTKTASYNVYSETSLDKVKVAAIMLLYKKLHLDQLSYLTAKLNLLLDKDVDNRLKHKLKLLTSPDVDLKLLKKLQLLKSITTSTGKQPHRISWPMKQNYDWAKFKRGKFLFSNVPHYLVSVKDGVIPVEAIHKLAKKSELSDKNDPWYLPPPPINGVYQKQKQDPKFIPYPYYPVSGVDEESALKIKARNLDNAFLNSLASKLSSQDLNAKSKLDAKGRFASGLFQIRGPILQDAIKAKAIPENTTLNNLLGNQQLSEKAANFLITKIRQSYPKASPTAQYALYFRGPNAYRKYKRQQIASKLPVKDILQWSKQFPEVNSFSSIYNKLLLKLNAVYNR